MPNPPRAPCVSVVMPFFNAARWIGQAVRSLADTGGINIELIAVDDGSTDASAEIIERTSTFPYRIVRNEQNCGTAKSLNTGLSLASGEFVARMDADDICLPGRFAAQIAHIRRTSCDLCGTWIREFGQGMSRRLEYPVGEETVRATLLFQNPVCHPTILARREVFRDYRYDGEYRVAQDYDLLSRISDRFRIDNVPEILLRYRRHSSQTTLAKRERVTSAADRIRAETLSRRGFNPTANELRLHNLIRSPRSIRSAEDLHGIEAWLMRLHGAHDGPYAQRVIASQWINACVRAAPLGKEMWRAYTRSPLRESARSGRATDANLFVLSRLALDYEGALFQKIMRFRIGA